MKCERCSEDAVVHFTQIMGGEMKTMHLCETCAAEKGLDPSPPTSTFQLSNLLAQMGPGTEGAAASVVSGTCSFCGLELADFRESGRFGCPHCYTAFEKGLRGLLRRIHGATEHVGKVYLPADPTAGDRSRRLDGLKRKLQRAVDAEDFERAAELRDQIRSIEIETV